MKWLIVAEGAHEVGDFNRRKQCPPEKEKDVVRSLEALVRRIQSQAGISLHLPQPDVLPISDPNLEVRAGNGNGYHRRLVAWLRRADREEYDFVVIVFDEDDDPRHDKRKAVEDASATILETSIPRAIGLAIRSFDAWILADQRAMQKLLNANVPYISRPEDEPTPKALCEGLAMNAGYDGAMRKFYFEMASQLDVSTVEKHCPQGFKPFADRVRNLLASLP